MLNSPSVIPAAPPQRKKPKKLRTRHAGMLLAGIGFVANITAIAGLFNSHANTIAITAAILAILSGLYLLLKRWNQPTNWYTLGAVAFLVAGSVGLALALKARTSALDTPNDQTSVVTPAHDTGSGDGLPVKKNSTHSVVFEKDFKLTNNEGLELDDEKGTIAVQQSYAKAPIDLFLNNYPVFYVSIKHFFAYQAPDQPTGKLNTDQFNACSNLIENSQLGSGSISSYAVVPGQQYCITTSKGRVALITMLEMVNDAYDSAKNNVTFTVKLWN